jgi:hypothetical protein
MKTLLLSAALVLFAVTGSASLNDDSRAVAYRTVATSRLAAKSVTVSGYLMDNMCAPKVMLDKEHAVESAASHDKTCLTEEICRRTGYGIVTTDGVFYPFDKKGSARAEKIAMATTKDDHISVKATGQIKGGKFVVSSIAAD